MLKVILSLICVFWFATIVSGQSTPDLETTMCVGDTAVMTVSVTDADSMQWYRNGNVIAGANSDTLIATLGGNYYLKAFRGQCNDVSGDIRIFIAYPRANDDYVLAPLGSLTTFDVLINDNASCAPFDKSSFKIIAPPTIGTLVSSAEGKIVYKPPPVTLGIDRFTYIIKDIEGRVTNEATVSVELYIDCAIVYPNPVEDILNISVNNNKIHAIKIYDAWGREIYHTAVSNMQLKVNMKPYAQGFYLVKLFDHNGVGCSVRVFKK